MKIFVISICCCLLSILNCHGENYEILDKFKELSERYKINWRAEDSGWGQVKKLPTQDRNLMVDEMSEVLLRLIKDDDWQKAKFDRKEKNGYYLDGAMRFIGCFGTDAQRIHAFRDLPSYGLEAYRAANNLSFANKREAVEIMERYAESLFPLMDRLIQEPEGKRAFGGTEAAYFDNVAKAIARSSHPSGGPAARRLVKKYLSRYKSKFRAGYVEMVKSSLEKAEKDRERILRQDFPVIEPEDPARPKWRSKPSDWPGGESAIFTTLTSPQYLLPGLGILLILGILGWRVVRRHQS